MNYLKTFNSPFKQPTLKWYFGKIAIGTPYFYPRKWVKDPNKPGYQKAIPKKIGFDFVSLGWKTKWTNTDYRFEWSPLASFVFFGLQIAVTVVASEANHFWEAWLYYERNTDHSLSKEERIQKCIEEFPLIYTVHQTNKPKETINYYNKILKPKYLKYVKNYT
jgi:hypothetical protein